MLLAVRISSYERTWEVWRALKKLELLSAAPRATLTHFSWSPNFPRASITRYTHANHEKILNFLLRLIINKIFVIALVSKRNILINVFLGLSDMISAHMTTCTASEGSMKQSALDIWKSRQIHFYFDEVIQKLLTINILPMPTLSQLDAQPWLFQARHLCHRLRSRRPLESLKSRNRVLRTQNEYWLNR